MHCKNCNQVTTSSQPFILTKINSTTYKLVSLCSICKRPKGKFLPKNVVPFEFMVLESRETYINYIPNNRNVMVPIEPFVGKFI